MSLVESRGGREDMEVAVKGGGGDKGQQRASSKSSPAFPQSFVLDLHLALSSLASLYLLPIFVVGLLPSCNTYTVYLLQYIYRIAASLGRLPSTNRTSHEALLLTHTLMVDLPLVPALPLRRAQLLNVPLGQ